MNTFRCFDLVSLARQRAKEEPGVCGWLAVGTLALLITCGCAKREPTANIQRYVPSTDAARSAVVAVLDEWKTTRDRNLNRSGLPRIEVVDNHRKAGRPLTAYRIIAQTSFAEGRRVHVELSWAQPDEVEKVRFVVFGIDPLWVFRQEDYDLIAHWDHAMPPPGQVDAAEASADVPAANDE